MKLRYKVLVVWVALGLAFSMFLDSAQSSATGGQSSARVEAVTLRSLGLAVPPQGPPTVTAELGFDYDFPQLVAKYRVYDRGIDLNCQGPRTLIAETATGTPPTDSFPRQTPDPSDDPIPLQLAFSAHCLEIVPVSASGAEGQALTFPFGEPPLPAAKNPKLWRVTF